MAKPGTMGAPILPWNASMPALIPELIAMASDPTVKTADLLLKALVCTESNQFKTTDPRAIRKILED